MNNAQIDLVWKNLPSGNTPLNADNLNKMVRSINLTDENVHNLDANKATKNEVAPLIADVDFDEKHGIFTFIRKDSVRYQARIWDTKLEQLVENLDFDEDTQQLIIIKADGTPIYVDVSAFVKPNEFLNSDTVIFSIESGGKVSAIVKEGSIEEKHLRPNYLAEIKIEVGKAETSRIEAAESATESESWAHGGTNTRPNEETDNAKAYAKKAEEYSNDWKGSLLPKGAILFSELPTSGNVAGHLYNITNAFTSDGRFKDGAGYSYPAGTNVYWTDDGKWDCLSGNLTKEITQAEYDALSSAEKLNGTIYYILDADNSMSVDNQLSTTSINPVQNRVITQALNQEIERAKAAEALGKSYTDTKIGDLINGAPSTLDTLGEIAEAMENNQGVVESLNAAIGNKVDKVQGKGLSTNDFTTIEKTKLAGIENGANVNVQVNWDITDTNSDAYIKNKPTSLKNPNALTFTGGVTGSYDGSSAKSVAIPTTLPASDTTSNYSATGTAPVNGVAVNKALQTLNAASIGAIPSSGGTVSGALTITGTTTLQGDVRIKKASSNYGSVINIGDGDYIRISEETDDCLTVKAKRININSTNMNAVYINEELAARYKKLTQTEYDALPSSKNSNNVIYFITD